MLTATELKSLHYSIYLFNTDINPGNPPPPFSKHEPPELDVSGTAWRSFVLVRLKLKPRDNLRADNRPFRSYRSTSNHSHPLFP